MIGIIINKAINEGFRQFIGAYPYERNENRRDHRSGFRKRSFETFKGKWIREVPKVVECLEKDYETIFTFYRFPYDAGRRSGALK